MKACTRDTYGEADVLAVRDVDTPTPAADEVLVQVRASSNDRGVWHLMTGRPYLMRPFTGLRAPKVRVLGRAFAGTVTAVGPNVTRFGPGDAVFGTSGHGTWAEYTAAPEKLVAPMPANVSPEQAAAAVISGVTALQALRDTAKLRPGQHVLVIGAAGGVGSFAVMIAKSMGATVTGVCSTSKVDLVRSLGADDVVDYTREEVDARGPRYDVVVDTAGNRPLSLLARALTPDGTVALVGGEDKQGLLLHGFERQLFAPLTGLRHRRTMRNVLTRENAADLAALGELMSSGAVTPAIVHTYPLADAPEAMRYLAAGHPAGKVVITV
ncbi:NAD(P)-dependent alcohol dehydrogenase [Cryptosporangium phraense]|uniref:NAD(P)-dependent alcohol dehydrogenase n=1 Tax=Cryptosporangium phraense TaxID=2593070 RepID=A0A545AGB1_9ACTN|nr:NAD(P)-dependent alcohol dehydrogenase [Cryptosporangium phraense]TQS40341.1 NAD(P)-dependent alcohol dehydrogenase [Cryptosporangium phraense]